MMGKHAQIYTAGTLRYTTRAVFWLFFWMLLGSFVFSMLERIIPILLPLTFKQFGCSNQTIGLLVGSLPSALNILINPGISFKSDRLRSKWGRRIPGGFVDYERLSPELFRSVQPETTFHDVIQEEIASPVEYEVALRIPFVLFQETTNVPPPRPGTRWHGNFFKCADESSRPHWASWQPIGEELNFHQPHYFGELLFQ